MKIILNIISNIMFILDKFQREKQKTETKKDYYIYNLIINTIIELYLSIIFVQKLINKKIIN
jgi:hypothetical protein